MPARTRRRRPVAVEPPVSPSEHPQCVRATLHLHEPRFAADVEDDLLLNPRCFPGFKLGDILRISEEPRETKQTKEARQNDLFLQVDSLESVKGTLAISVRKELAERFGLKNRSEVYVDKVRPQDIFLDFVELSFKDQYISRGDMWRLREDLQGQCFYISKQVAAHGNVAQINDMLVDGQSVASGVVGPDTKWIFRSRSARLMWLVQLSEEMWDCADDGELYREKVTNRLVNVILDKWQELRTHHSLTVILFARTIYSSKSSKPSTPMTERFQRDHRQRLYQDFFNVIIDQQPIREDAKNSMRDLEQMRVNLKRNINLFSASVSWGKVDAESGLQGHPSRAQEGNVLEAMNLALNVYDKHYIDRDLQRTGLGMVVFTAGNGVMYVDRELAALTKQRMMDNGVGCDFISVAKPPIHAVPLFIYKPYCESMSNLGQNTDTFEVPREWILMNYFDEKTYCDSSSLSRQILKKRGQTTQFVPLPICRLASLEFDQLPIFLDKEPLKTRLEFFNANSTQERIELKSPHMELFEYNGISEHLIYDQSLFDCVFPQKIALEHASKSLSHSPNETPKNSVARSSIFTFESNPFASSIPKEISDHQSSFIFQSLISPRRDLSPKLSSSLSLHAVTDLYFPKRTLFQRKLNILPTDFNDQSDVILRKNAERLSRLLLKNDDSPNIYQLRGGSSVKTDRTGGEVCSKFSCFLLEFESIDERESFHFIANQDFLPTELNALKTSYINSHDFEDDSRNQIEEEPTLNEDGETSRINPFKILPQPLNSTSTRRRWLHLLQSPLEDFETPENLNMKSLAIPAILPLTCDYFPSHVERAKHFVNYVHTLSFVPGEVGHGTLSRSLLTELITQRLAQDFQVVSSALRPQSVGFPHVGSNQSIVALRKQSNQDNKSMSASAFAVSSLQVPISTSMTARERVLLSTADECHVIEADFSSGNIEVQRYVRRGSRSSLFQNKKLMSYKYHLWSDNSNRFHLMEVPIAPTHYEYNWNYVDQLLCGFHEQFPPNIKYRRQRFALVPQHADGIRFISSESKAEFHFKTFMERMTRQQFGMLNIVFELNDNRDYNRANSTRKFPFTAAHLLQNGFCSFTDSKTGQVRISLDSSRSDRHEWIIIRYESEYAANSVYFIEILWLVASSALVEQYLQDCSLHAKSCGFNMIQVPSRLPSPDPFHIVHCIRLESAAMSKLILNSLLKEWGFVLDRVSKVDFRWQVIHSSGMALIRASESGLNIEWVSNHLLSAQYLRLSCLTLFRAFRRYCNFLNSMRQIAVQMCVQSIEKDNVV